LLCLVGVVVLGYLLLQGVRDRSGSEKSVSTLTTTPLERVPASPLPPENLPERLSACVRELQSQSDILQKNEQLKTLGENLKAVPVSEMSQAIEAFLNSNLDAPTGAGFKVGSNGALDESPTLRVFLLDRIGQRDPAAGAAYSEIVLRTNNSADEWAVSLRNLALGSTNAEARRLLEEKTRELLRRDDWLQNPSAGYFEAFDVAVYLGGTGLVSDLTRLLRNSAGKEVTHAASLALDRLVLADPVGMLRVLQARELLDGHEETRAQLFARADVRDPRQRQFLETYLLNPRMGADELNTFARVYPNADFTISNNLLTPKPTSKPGDISARDAESLRIVDEWSGDARFRGLQPQLKRIRSRLKEFLKEAAP
jgi:hypothetical protein